ncbi:hypothetical protein V8G54_009563 [Vigna mungo]|uniref:Uncharacterized protein n=1 Tax=Vigna mungo TaxID=3915 RepID=A0AAQ3NWZ2_VIGMU
MKTMMCHIHYSSSDSITSDGLKNLLVINHTKSTFQLYKRNALASFDDEEWQRVLSNIDTGNQNEGPRRTLAQETILTTVLAFLRRLLWSGEKRAWSGCHKGSSRVKFLWIQVELSRGKSIFSRVGANPPLAMFGYAYASPNSIKIKSDLARSRLS